jgi:hypothetical protein
MAALLALICFVLALFGVSARLGIDLVVLGLVFVALHLLLTPELRGALPWRRT